MVSPPTTTAELNVPGLLNWSDKNSLYSYGGDANNSVRFDFQRNTAIGVLANSKMYPAIDRKSCSMYLSKKAPKCQCTHSTKPEH